METINIEVIGLDRLIKKLGRLQTFSELRGPLTEGVSIIHGAVANYPAPPPNSTYRRTGTLGRRWTTKVETLTTFKGTVGNNTIYGPYVQDRGKQARIHRGRWQTIQDVVDQKRDEIVALFRRKIQELLNS